MTQKEQSAVLEESQNFDLTIDQMHEANWHFGDLEKETHPSMRPYVLKYIKSYAVINIAQSKSLFFEALKFLTKIVSSGGKILIACKDQKMSRIVESAAKESSQFYIAGKWPAGLITNWNTFSKAISSIKEREANLLNPTMIKREQVKLQKRLTKEKALLAGVLEMNHLPAAVVIISGKDRKPIEECYKSDIPTVALIDTSSDARNIPYPVPGNALSMSTASLFLSYIVDICKEHGLSHDEQNLIRKIEKIHPKNFKQTVNLT